jgi:hypothetical protein
MVPEARAELRATDRETAIQILNFFFDHSDENRVDITSVRHRREPYR